MRPPLCEGGLALRLFRWYLSGTPRAAKGVVWRLITPFAAQGVPPYLLPTPEPCPIFSVIGRSPIVSSICVLKSVRWPWFPTPRSGCFDAGELQSPRQRGQVHVFGRRFFAKQGPLSRKMGMVHFRWHLGGTP